MRKFKNAFEAYWWFFDHPKLQFEHYDPWIEMTPHMVNPKKGEIDDDPSLNTKQEWWIEAGPYVKDEHMGVVISHDWKLDCGGDTIDEALIKLANLTLEHYGDYNDS